MSEEGEFECWHPDCDRVFDSKQARGAHFGAKHELTDEMLIDAVHELADRPEVDGTPHARDMDKYGNYSIRPYITHFGSWNDALKAAGYDVNVEVNISRNDLVNSIHDLIYHPEVNGTPTCDDINTYGEYSVRPYISIFGTLTNAMIEAGYEPNPRGAQSGEDHHNYKHGNSGGHYYGPNWKQEREARIEYDNEQCVHCGMTDEEHHEEYDQGLHVHHVVPFENYKPCETEEDYAVANAIENLVTLCSEHHAEWEHRYPCLRPQVVSAD